MWSNHISSITGGTRKCYIHWRQVSGSIFFLFFSYFLKKQNFNFWLHWVFIAEHWLSLVAVSGGYSVVGRLLIAEQGLCSSGLQ